MQDQALLNDLIGLEDKYGDTLGQMPYFEPSNMMLPQTVSHLLSRIIIIFTFDSCHYPSHGSSFQ